MICVLMLALVILAATWALLYIKRIDTYWERRGLYTFRSRNKTENFISAMYKELKLKGIKYAGYSRHFRPAFTTTDLEIIKSILIKNADHFVNRGFYTNPKGDLMSGTLIRLQNEEWKNTRHLVSPIFSSGKMRRIFPDLANHADIMLKVLKHYAESNQAVEAKELAQKFGMDALGSCTFGLEINTLKGMNEDFHKLVKTFFMFNWRKIAENIVNERIFSLLRLRMTDPKVEEFVTNIINDTEAYREKHNIQRNDIFHYVTQLTETRVGKTESKQLSHDQMIVQLYTFFTGGFETSSTLVCFALLELSLHQDVQDQLRDEIHNKLKFHGKFTYEAIMDMGYLDCVINETLRKNPPVSSVDRICNKSFSIANTDIVIHPGEFVTVPILGLHMDADYYPEPDKFDPLRFLTANKAKRNPLTFLPFGGGARYCIGSRLALLISKVAVASIINEFRVTVNDKTIIPIKYNMGSFFLSVEGGTWVNFSKV